MDYYYLCMPNFSLFLIMHNNSNESNNIKINSWFILIFKKNLKIKFSKFKKRKFDI